MFGFHIPADFTERRAFALTIEDFILNPKLSHMNQTLKENTEAVEQMRKSMNASTKAEHELKQTQKMTKEEYRFC